ncbi:putative methyltransferase PMT13 [Sesamum angolense]|uniref:Methyltransferase n=1 Tax=Sesamum angolense TaxID=2727404 RepID=A0AAE1WPM0_9LAMI|nr:putative methyltransferase PMT13 [Sesamum angolense]
MRQMGLFNLASSKQRNARKWRLLDIITAAFFLGVLVLFLLVFTPLGDAFAASGRKTALRSPGLDPRNRGKLLALLELGRQGVTMDACPADMVDHMPCEDPRINSQLSREMNYYRERHCPKAEETPLCLIPPPQGYRVPVQWPESLHKIWHDNMPYNKIADRKGHQGWMKREGPYFIFPGGGTMFPDGAVQRLFTLQKATYFLEVDRLLRPGGYLVISGPPVQWPKQEKEWADLQGVARSLCYQLIVVDGNTVIWKKPNGDSCLPNQNEFGLHLCDESNEPRLLPREYAVGTIPNWPERLQKAPSRASVMENGTDVFEVDNQRWTRRIAYYKNTLKIKLGTPSIRNIMDMNAFFGGFAAAIISDPVWVMNVVPSSKTLTLDVIYDRGLIGVYHDWCEPFSTYPRTYDLIHVDDIESLLKDPSSGMSRCNLVDLMVEIDRMLRPKGTVIIRDSPEAIDKLSHISHALRWTTSVHEKEPGSHGRERVLVATKSLWKLTSASH